MGQRRSVGLVACWAVLVVVVALVGLGRLGGVSATPAVVAGTYKITVTGGSGAIGSQPLVLAPACSNGIDDDLDTKIDYPEDSGCASPQDNSEGPDTTVYVPPTMTVALDSAGNVSAPASGVVWQDILQRFDTGFPLGVKDLLVQFKADDVDAKSVTGHLDAATGAISLRWRFHIQASIVGVPGTLLIGSPTAPLTANLTSAGSGTAYDPRTRKATLVDADITFPAATCVDNPLVCPLMVPVANSRLGLPTKAGESKLSVTGEVDPDPIADDVTPVPDLKLAKSHEGAFTVGVGGAYSLVVSNVGTAPSSGDVTVTDTLPAGLAFVSAGGDGWTCAAVAQVVTCSSSAVVAAAASAPAITLVAKPSEAGSVTNTATVSNGSDSDADNNGASDPTTVEGEPPPGTPDLTLVKSHEGDFTMGVGGAYSLVVSNVGTAPSSGDVTVTDTLPAGLAFVSAGGDGWTCAAVAQVVTCSSSAVVAAAASAPAITLVAKLPTAGTVTNTATVAGGGESNTLNNGASDPTTVKVEPPPATPDLTLVKSHEGDFTVGVGGAYSLVVSNVGTAPSSGDVTVTDTLPAGLAFVSAGGDGWTCAAVAQVVTCSSSAVVAAGGSAPAITLAVMPSEAGPVTNTATVAGGGESNTLDDGASDPTDIVEAPPVEAPDVAVLKSHAGRFAQGVQGTYAIRVGNVGKAPTSGTVTLVDDLPEGLDYVDVNVPDASGWVCHEESGKVTCLHESAIAAGAPYSEIGIVVKPTTHGPVTNVAIVSAPGDTNPDNDEASDPTEIDPPPAPNLTVEVAAPSMTVGTASTITVKVANAGSAPTSGPVNLAIPVPVTLGLTSASGTGWNCTNAGANETVLNVACVTQASVTPGSTLPVVNLAVTPKSAGTFDVGAKVSTEGDVTPSDNSKVVQVVVAGSTTGGSGNTAQEMPFTGGDLGRIVAAALAVLGAGGGLVRASRRRTAPI